MCNWEKKIEPTLILMVLDSLKLFNTGKDMELKLIKTDIAWPSDRKIKFNNPPGKLDDTEGMYCYSCVVVSPFRCRCRVCWELGHRTYEWDRLAIDTYIWKLCKEENVLKKSLIIFQAYKS